MASTRSKRKPSAAKNYRVTLTMGDYVFDTESDTLLEAIESVIPDFAKGYAVIKVEHGTLVSGRKLFPVLLRRLKVNKISRQLLEKRLMLAMR